MTEPLECRRLRPEHAGALAELFEELRREGIDRHFHPHPLDEETAAAIAGHPGRDLYYALTEDGSVLAYGMLRGWDEGFDVPSLGMAVAPDARGRGLGELLLGFLHHAARLRGATRVRLKVYPENEEALRLYRSAGYVFDGSESGQLVGVVEVT